jgi:hypothetical protein
MYFDDEDTFQKSRTTSLDYKITVYNYVEFHVETTTYKHSKITTNLNTTHITLNKSTL